MALSDLEKAYPELPRVKSQRTTLEYYYTCTPLVMDYAMKNCADADSVTYIDADISFFDHPDRVFDEIGPAPVAIIPHNFGPHCKTFERFGIFNVGWVTFTRSQEGIACLEWWRDRCLEWCYGYIDNGRCGDQGYLSWFSEIAPNTKILTHKGCNTGPWNIENYTVSIRDGRIFVDNDPLIFFHFYGVKRGLGVFYFDSHRHYGAPLTRLVRNNIYRPYIEALCGKEAVVAELLPVLNSNGVKLRGKTVLGIDIKNLARSLRVLSQHIADLVSGRPIFTWRSRFY